MSVCGYYYLPDNHPGDTAQLLRELQEVDVKVFELTDSVTVDGAHEIGPGGETDGYTLPKGTLWVPLAQTQKHWIQTVLGEDPYVPFYYFYDVAQWSYSHTWGMSGGNGLLREQMPSNAPMVELTSPVHFGGVTNPTKPVLAFKTDSADGTALAMDLLYKGVKVYRGKDAFTSGGRSFPTGTGFIDTANLGSLTLTEVEELADDRDSPLTGLDNYPVPHYDLGGVPKIGVFTGATTVPGTPISTPQGQCSSTGYCYPMFGLTQKYGFPPHTNTDPRTPMIVPVTTTQVASSATYLKDQGFTAVYGGATTVPAGVGATDLQDFVNSGGKYVGYGAGALTSLRNAGVTTVNTSATNVAPFTDACEVGGTGLRTNGANFKASIDTTNPVGWGYDTGGSIFRTGTTVIDPATLGTATAVFSYPDPLVSPGYTCNATGAGELPGRPAIINQQFGAGAATVFDADPFYRSWLPQQERTVMSAFLEPTGAELPATAPAAPVVESAPADKPIADKALPEVKSRPAVVSYDASKTLIISVTRGKNNRKAKVLRKAIKVAGIPAATRKNIKWVKGRKALTLKIKNGKAYDSETQPGWIYQVDRFLIRKKVHTLTWDVTNG